MGGLEETNEMTQLSITDNDETIFLIYAKERHNYVAPIKIFAFQIKSPAKFGWKTAPCFGKEDNREGELCRISLSALRGFRPNCLEIADVGCPLSEFMSKLGQDGLELFEKIRWLRIYESSGDIDLICSILQHAKALTSVELYESQCGIDERERILEILATRNQLKAFDFIYGYDGLELHKWFSELRMKLRIIRFSGPPGVKYTAIRNVKVDLPVVEFAAIQDIDLDIAQDDPLNKTWHRDLFNRLCHILPSVKYLYFDYKVFDTVFIYDNDTVKIFETFRDFYRRLKLVCFAILIYCPDAEMKESVAKAANFLSVDCNIRTEMKEFFCGSGDVCDAPPNFSLLVLGDQTHARTLRLIETIVGQKNTTPDLRHFCYMMDMDAFLNPDCSIAFGGFDNETVEKMYKENHDSFSTAQFVPDSILERHVKG